MSNGPSTPTPAAGEHLSPTTIRRLAQGGLAPELAKEALAHLRLCGACQQAVDQAYRVRYTDVGARRRPVPKSLVRVLAAAALLAIGAILCQVVTARGLLTRQRLDRRPFSAGLVEYDREGSGSGVAVVYTDSGVIPLAPEAPGPDDLEGRHYPSPPSPVDPTVLPTTRTDRRDLIVGSRSTYRPRGRVHLVRWEHRTNRFQCVYVLDILDYIPNAKAETLRDIAIEQVAVARSRRPEELPRVLVWWRHHDDDHGGVSVFSYDQDAGDDPLLYHGTVFASSWAFPVSPLPAFEPVLRTPEGEHDLIPLVWRVNTLLAGEGIVPRPDDGIGVGVTLIDPFTIAGDCVSPFAAPELPEELDLPTDHGLGSWLIPRFAPYPDASTTLYVAQEVLAGGRLMLHVNTQAYTLDAVEVSLEYDGSCDIWDEAVGDDLEERGEALFRDQVHPIGPPGDDPVAPPDADSIDGLLAEDRQAWQELYRTYDRDHTSASYRQRLDDYYAPH